MKTRPLFRNIFIFVGLLLGVRSSVNAQAFSFELMTGTALNLPTPLTVHQTGYPDINVSANYDTEPFGPYTPYYAWRASLWNGDEAWEFEQVHHRLFLTNPPPEIQYFAIHFGYNFLLVGHSWRNPVFTLHLDTGPIITNPANTVRGQVLHTGGTGWFDQGYDFSGWGAQVSLSRDFYFSHNFYFVVELGFIYGWAWDVPVSNGYADVPNAAFHGHIGPGFSF